MMRQTSNEDEQPSPKGLKPLAPPRGSALWIHKEPKEFLAQRERMAEREARKSLRLAYRGALQELGHPVCLQRPTIKSTIDSDPPARFERPPLSTVLGPPPYKGLEDKPQKPDKLKSTMRSKTASSAFEDPDPRAIVGGERVRMTKDMWRTLKDWSRFDRGAPWTLNQVYAEIEADLQHRTSRDTRAKRGHMGPEEIGPGTTRGRRRMVSFERNFERKDPKAGSAAASFSASFGGMRDTNDPSTTIIRKAKSDSSLPALTQSPS